MSISGVILAASDEGAALFGFFIIAVLIWGIANAFKPKKPKGKWVYVEEKPKGCLGVFFIFAAGVAWLTFTLLA